MALDRERAVAEIQAAVAHLQQMAAVYLATRIFRSRTLISGRSLSVGLIWETLHGA
jgi:hypothetical protein